MNKIVSFVVQPGQQQIMIPSDSILSAGSLKDDIVLYVLNNTEDTYERPYDVSVYETNQVIESEIGDFEFLGTVKKADEKVYHVFYKGISSMDL